MQQQMDGMRQQMAQSLSHNAQLLQQQLESVNQNLRNSSGDINVRLDNAAKLLAAFCLSVTSDANWIP